MGDPILMFLKNFSKRLRKCFTKDFQPRYRYMLYLQEKLVYKRTSIGAILPQPYCIHFIIDFLRWFESTFKVLTGIVPGYLLAQIVDVKK